MVSDGNGAVTDEGDNGILFVKLKVNNNPRSVTFATRRRCLKFPPKNSFRFHLQIDSESRE